MKPPEPGWWLAGRARSKIKLSGSGYDFARGSGPPEIVHQAEPRGARLARRPVEARLHGPAHPSRQRKPLLIRSGLGGCLQVCRHVGRHNR